MTPVVAARATLGTREMQFHSPTETMQVSPLGPSPIVKIVESNYLVGQCIMSGGCHMAAPKSVLSDESTPIVVTATEFAKNLSDILNRVKYKGERF